MYSIALYYFRGNTAAASDVTQQVFLKLMTSITQYRGDASFSTWIYRVVVNACTDASRRHKGGDSALLERLPERRPSQHDAYAREQTVEQVQKAVAQLPEKFRIAVLLRYFDELSYEQMAEALNCSLGTVASRLSRGHKMLAERLKGI